MSEPVSPAAAAILAELRDRKLLKYLFDREPDNCGAYGYVNEPIELGIQHEIVEALAAAAIGALGSDLLTEAQREFWAQRGASSRA